jgi:hypothetical protein
MAKQDHPFSWEGRIKYLHFYKMNRVKGTVVRSNGGPTRAQILHGENYEKARNYMSEFKARAGAAKSVKEAILPLKKIVGGMFIGRFTKMATVIQCKDFKSEIGRRDILFSEHGELLEDFELNPEKTFDSFFSRKIAVTMNRENGTAKLVVSAFKMPLKNAPFRFVATLGIVPDITFRRVKTSEAWETERMESGISMVGDWLAAGKAVKAQTFTLKFNRLPQKQGYVMLVAIGIQFGKKESKLVITPLTDAVGKILKVG